MLPLRQCQTDAIHIFQTCADPEINLSLCTGAGKIRILCELTAISSGRTPVATAVAKQVGIGMGAGDTFVNQHKSTLTEAGFEIAFE